MSDATLRPMSPETMPLVVDWLQDPLVTKYLDFGGGRRQLTAAQLAAYLKSPATFVRVLHDVDGRAYGLICFRLIPTDRAMVWGLRANLRPPARTHTGGEMLKFLKIGFEELNLRVVTTWAVECNRLSIRAIRHAGFRLSGRERLAHEIDGVFYDRIHFDLLRQEFFEDQQAPSATSG